MKPSAKKQFIIHFFCVINTVLDVTLITAGLHVYTFYSCYNMEWIANTEISLDPNNSVIKRLWYTNKIVNFGTFLVILKFCFKDKILRFYNIVTPARIIAKDLNQTAPLSKNLE